MVDKEGDLEAQRRLKDYFVNAQSEVGYLLYMLSISLFVCMYVCMYECFKKIVGKEDFEHIFE